MKKRSPSSGGGRGDGSGDTEKLIGAGGALMAVLFIMAMYYHLAYKEITWKEFTKDYLSKVIYVLSTGMPGYVFSFQCSPRLMPPHSSLYHIPLPFTNSKGEVVVYYC